MNRKISQVFVLIVVMLMFTGCKNTKQKLQEFVVAYNKDAANFKGEHIRTTTARGYIYDSKIELRIETDLPQSKENVASVSKIFPGLLSNMISKGQIPSELVNEGVRFDVYYLANDNTVLAKEIINKEEINKFLIK